MPVNVSVFLPAFSFNGFPVHSVISSYIFFFLRSFNSFIWSATEFISYWMNLIVPSSMFQKVCITMNFIYFETGLEFQELSKWFLWKMWKLVNSQCLSEKTLDFVTISIQWKTKKESEILRRGKIHNSLFVSFPRTFVKLN